MQHTDSQTQDWLHLRELFYFKIGQLARERKALLINMTQYQMDMGHVSDKLTRMTKWSDHLRLNGAEEYRSYCMFATAFLRGVCFSFIQKAYCCPPCLYGQSLSHSTPPPLQLMMLCIDVCIYMHT